MTLRFISRLDAISITTLLGASEKALTYARLCEYVPQVEAQAVDGFSYLFAYHAISAKDTQRAP